MRVRVRARVRVRVRVRERVRVRARVRGPRTGLELLGAVLEILGARAQAADRLLQRRQMHAT